MNYRKVSSEELFIAMNSGWNPTFFVIKGNTLQVDLCVDFALGSNKILFFSVE